eukprot:4051035-Pyramimonas_sp.AAC.1
MLEESSISHRMTNVYDYYLMELRDFWAVNGLPAGIGAGADLALVDYFDAKFLDGHGPSLAEKVIAAV